MDTQTFNLSGGQQEFDNLKRMLEARGVTVPSGNHGEFNDPAHGISGSVDFDGHHGLSVGVAQKPFFIGAGRVFGTMQEQLTKYEAAHGHQSWDQTHEGHTQLASATGTDLEQKHAELAEQFRTQPALGDVAANYHEQLAAAGQLRADGHELGLPEDHVHTMATAAVRDAQQTATEGIQGRVGLMASLETHQRGVSQGAEHEQHTASMA